MSWRKFFELAYTAVIGFEVAFIIDLTRALMR
jgi:hypothetical protein